MLGDTFTLAADFIDCIRFRLAGTRVCALFRREVRGESFSALWNAANRAQIADIMTAVVEETNGVVAGVTGLAEKGDETDLELLLLPIRRDARTRVRAMGSLRPLEPLYWLGGKQLIKLELHALRNIGAGAEPTRSEANRRRGRHGFRLYSGGLEPGPRGGLTQR